MEKSNKMQKSVALLLVALLLAGHPVNAMEIVTATVPVRPENPDIVSIELPVNKEDEESPLDCILDPQGLIYATNAARYGGGIVEEGATLYFHNTEGAFDYSHISDRQTVINKSLVPVRVTIKAWIDDLEGVQMLPDDVFDESDDTSMYLAIVDDEGGCWPILEDRKVSVTREMEAAEGNAYVYVLDEEQQSLQYQEEDADFTSYSFSLTGACNPNGNWRGMDAPVAVHVSWEFEPLIDEDSMSPQNKDEGAGTQMTEDGAAVDADQGGESIKDGDFPQFGAGEPDSADYITNPVDGSMDSQDLNSESKEAATQDGAASENQSSEHALNDEEADGQNLPTGKPAVSGQDIE